MSEVMSDFSSMVVLLLAFSLTSPSWAADTLAPTVTITQPTPGTTLTGRANLVTVAASDASGVTNVVLKIDGATVGAAFQKSPYGFALDTSELPNGMHTLLAVAMDGAGKQARSAIVAVNVTNLPAYTLGAGPYVVQDLGLLLTANTADKDRSFMFRDWSNDVHWVSLYYSADINTQPFEFADVNITQSTIRKITGTTGRPGVYAQAFNSFNGKLYLATQHYKLFEYDPIAGTGTNVATLHQEQVQILSIGDDGMVYIGECCNGGVERYNPTNGVLENFGTNAGSYQYTTTLHSDGNFIYAGYGESPWYLSIYNIATSNKTYYWNDQQDTLSGIYPGTNNYPGSNQWFYFRGSTPRENYWLSNGVPVLLATNPVVHYHWDLHDGITQQVTNFWKSYSLEANTDEANPDSVSNSATFKWRPASSSDPYSSATATNWYLTPVAIKRAYPLADGSLLCVMDSYGPIIRYFTATATQQTVGYPIINVKDIVFSGNTAFLSGYPGATLQYDQTADWTLTTSTPDISSTNVNPYKLAVDFGKYHYYSTLGADGLLYVGAHHERDSTGGELGWYDPVTATNGSLRDPFLDYDVRDLKPALGGTKLVYQSTSTNLFVFDVASKTIERTIVPLPSVSSPGKICEVAPGIIFGAADNKYFKVDISNGSILTTNTLPGTAFGGVATYDRRLATGPDGYVWMFIDNWIYRINPTDYSMTNLVNTAAGGITFNGGDLYIYGGPNLLRVRGVLKKAMPHPIGLHTVPAEP